MRFCAVILTLGMHMLTLQSNATCQSKGLELRAGLLGQLSKRNATLAGRAGRGSGTLAGVELLARSRYIGASVQLFGGAFSADSSSEAVGEIHRGDVRLIAGPQVLAGEVGYGLRSFVGAFGTRRWSIIRVGCRSALALGGSGLHASLNVALYASVSGSNESGDGGGREAETRLTYAPVGRPFYLALGYRFEQFTADDLAEQRPEETSGIVLAAGLRVRL